MELEGLLSISRLRVESSEPHAAQALDMFAKRASCNVVLSDWLIVALMPAKTIRPAVAYNGDFKKAGFEIIG